MGQVGWPGPILNSSQPYSCLYFLSPALKKYGPKWADPLFHLYVQLIQGLRLHSDHRQEKTNRGNLGDRGKCIIVVGTINLSVSLCN